MGLLLGIYSMFVDRLDAFPDGTTKSVEALTQLQSIASNQEKITHQTFSFCELSHDGRCHLQTAIISDLQGTP